MGESTDKKKVALVSFTIDDLLSGVASYLRGYQQLSTVESDGIVSQIEEVMKEDENRFATELTLWFTSVLSSVDTDYPVSEYFVDDLTSTDAQSTLDELIIDYILPTILWYIAGQVGGGKPLHYRGLTFTTPTHFAVTLSE